MNVAVDAMGGDYAPESVVQGAIEAVSGLDIHVTLVGHEKAIRETLGTNRTPDHISLHHCEGVVGMDESPLKALRKKKDSSISEALGLLKNGQVDAVISAGNSGATLAAAVLSLGRINGVERPGIASILPTERGPVVLIDVGANVDCRPAHLLHFGVMADAFSSTCLATKNPKIGLLSIGEEGTKGNELVRLARELFDKSDLNFVGNVEGRDIFTGEVDIIVCDGFVGNVALKLSEGVVKMMSRLIENELKSSILGRSARILGRKPIGRFKRRLNYEEYGGAPLLGVRGIVIICHGGSSVKAIKNAIRSTAGYVNDRVLEKMRFRLEDYKP